MKYLFLLIITSFLLSSCCTIHLGIKTYDRFINGGGNTSYTYYASSDSFYNSLKLGSAFCFYKDNLLGQNFGPDYSDTTIVFLSDKLITTISYLNLDQNVSEKTFSSKNTEFNFSSIASIDELLQLMSTSKLTLTYDFKKIIDLFLSTGLSKDVSIGEFLEKLLSSGLISQEEYTRLKNLILDKHFSLDDKLSKLITYLSENSLTINLNSQTFAHFIKQYSLMNFIDLEYLKNELLVGKPHIILIKKADRHQVWYGGNINYTFGYKNIGTVSAKDIYIIDALPVGLQFSYLLKSSNSTGVKVICHSVNQIIVFHIDDEIKPGDSGKFTFSVNVLKKH